MGVATKVGGAMGWNWGVAGRDKGGVAPGGRGWGWGGMARGGRGGSRGLLSGGRQAEGGAVWSALGGRGVVGRTGGLQ